MQQIGIKELNGHAMIWAASNVLIILTHWFLAFLSYTVPYGKFLVLMSIFSTIIHVFNIKHISSVAVLIKYEEWQIPDKCWTVENKNNLWDNAKYYFINTHVAIDIVFISIGLFYLIDLDNIKYNQSRPEFMITFIEYFWLLFCSSIPFILYISYRLFIDEMTMKKFYFL